MMRLERSTITGREGACFLLSTTLHTEHDHRLGVMVTGLEVQPIPSWGFEGGVLRDTVLLHVAN